MIGGQIIIPLRTTNGAKFKFTNGENVFLKAGTYEKIVRACKLQKELVFEDMNIDDYGDVNSASFLLKEGNDGAYLTSLSIFTSATTRKTYTFSFYTYLGSSVVRMDIVDETIGE